MKNTTLTVTFNAEKLDALKFHMSRKATREYLDDKISREQKVRDRPRPRRLIRTEASSESFSHQEDS